MKPFAYTRASEDREAVAIAAQDESAAFLAGGTDLLGLMKDGVRAPSSLVDINALPMAAVEAREGVLQLGALVRLSDAAEDPFVRDGFPALAQALLAAASPQLRNMATIGGSLLQRTRCGYFRDPLAPCNKRAPGSGCSAIDGDQRQHAIFGASDHCIAVHPSDPAVALLSLDALVRTRGPRGKRVIALDDLYLDPGSTPWRETQLEHGELIVRVDLADAPITRRSCYLKVRDRASFAFALVSVAVALDVRDGLICSARVALGGVAPRPWRCRTAERVLVGSRMNQPTITAAGLAAVAEARSRGRNEFKIELVRRVVTRALGVAGDLP